jgi:hypothetical protein
MGGNLELVKWLVESQDCPISVRRDPKSRILLSVQTSSLRTLVDLAMTGKPKIDILSYLVRKNLSVLDTKDHSLAPKTLQTLMSAGFRFEKRDIGDGLNESLRIVEASDASMATMEDAVSEEYKNLIRTTLLQSMVCRTHTSCQCILCCENHMDCCLIPCGHQICCSDCGAQMTSCPICKNPCSVLKIFRL